MSPPDPPPLPANRDRYPQARALAPAPAHIARSRRLWMIGTVLLAVVFVAVVLYVRNDTRKRQTLIRLREYHSLAQHGIVQLEEQVNNLRTQKAQQEALLAELSDLKAEVDGGPSERASKQQRAEGMIRFFESRLDEEGRRLRRAQQLRRELIELGHTPFR